MSALLTATGTTIGPPRPPLPLPFFESALVLPQLAISSVRQRHTVKQRNTRRRLAGVGDELFCICPLKGRISEICNPIQTSMFQQLRVITARNVPFVLRVNHSI